MARWLTYAGERFPLATYLILSGAMTWSGASLFQVSPFHAPIQSMLSLLGILLFFFELRLMDEWKDFEKDKIAHPDRPLPRGLLLPQEVRRGIGLGMGLMGAFTLGMALGGYDQAALLYLLITGYLWLMYREFYAGAALSARPFLYGFTHQLILLPLMAFPVAIFHSRAWQEARSLELGLAVLGAFFTYELCRKLDPNAHPVLKTYPQVYGRGGTVFRITLTTAIAILGSSLLDIEAVSVPPLMLTWLASVVWLFRPGIHKLVEGLATLSLLVHLACIPISRWIKLP